MILTSIPIFNNFRIRDFGGPAWRGYTAAKGPQDSWTNPPSPSIWICPSLARLPEMDWRFGAYGYNASGAASMLSSGWGLGLGGEFLAGASRPLVAGVNYLAIRAGRVRQPSEMIAVGDGWLVPGSPIHANPPLDDYIKLASSYWRTPPPLERKRHTGKLNLWFCDGHVEHLPLQNVTSRDDARVRRWNNDNQPHRDLLSP